MSDHCQNCTVRGDLEACRAVCERATSNPCDVPTSWGAAARIESAEKALADERRQHEVNIKRLKAELVRAAELESLLRETEAEFAAWKKKTYCAYCGKEYALDTDGAIIGEHIATCEKHPMRAVESTLAEERAKNARLRDAYELERQHSVRLVSAYERNPEDAWRWVGDGSDDLESMGADMAVLIRAADLRSLRARTDESGRLKRVAAELFRRSRLVDNRTFDEDRDYWMGIARDILAVADGDSQ